MTDPLHALTEELRLAGAHALAEPIGSALGGTADPSTWGTVLAHYAVYGNPYALHVITSRCYVQFEQAEDGTRLTTVEPLSVLRRVTSIERDDQIEVLVELDAEPFTFEIAHAGATAPHVAEGVPAGARTGQGQSQGRLLRAGHRFVASGADAGRLRSFAAAARAALHHRTTT